ncbi:MAG: bifunctional phosphopantothenoylcysteine decarboxylase/phosphopantothenate--cysteine ligase CoaBC [Candidatus Syntrophonatronum acetioxidans]|uniref:Coenzyme A biosynthesis bifunctional protein CoaBC n=1 Tax=Candidatus Syntrophonatronum acetioxidans TaxID=1795816 RepID=A0A424YHS7_9FIRM|nr:MAG: bifunctional phosphopantothenoylcysteine decarboxylase/phosphopantothenate--cysteine ligase CoaBC [Candidatus Syntrophonatronum acetioxidans]
MLEDKLVVLGVTGSIAVYKAVEICRLLIKKGARVKVIMTKAAEAFVAPLTFETITGGPVGTKMFGQVPSWDIQHISWAQEADLFLVAPATANVIGKVCHGIADDLLTTSIMATTSPVIFAPAMNREMYNNPVYQDNMKSLAARGYWFVEPGTGYLACGDEGKGRLAEPEEIVDYVINQLSRERDFANYRFLITAGPTREPLDPIRFFSNFSSGKMGYALAEAASQRGGEVTLISGPTNLTPPSGVIFVPVNTTLEMQGEVLKKFPQTDIVIKAAAVADYRPANPLKQKIKKEEEGLNIKLTPNPDILLELGKIKKDQVLVGFAAETENLVENAMKKIKKKNLDLIVANDLTRPGAGFEVDTNLVKVINRKGKIKEFPLMTKRELAHKILEVLLENLRDL